MSCEQEKLRLLDEIRELEAELAKRNDGECFGPFHGGFICADCARLTRELQARAEKAERQAEERGHEVHMLRLRNMDLQAREREEC